MLTILINAYACSPDMGSEPGMAWNWCVNLAKHCRLHVITEGEFRDKIEAALPQLPQGANMRFYYNPVPEKVRRMCWNQGDWRFYWHYRRWQKRTLRIAEQIVKENHIDVLHQLNMIGFREPGYLWRIQNIPFVWGPIGGMELIPTAYLKGEDMKTVLKSRLKNIINAWQMRHQPRVLKAMRRADMLVAATGGAYRVLHDCHKRPNVVLINETGCYETGFTPPYLTYNNNQGLRVLWVGKFDFRKQLALALRTIAHCGRGDMTLHVLGEGGKGAAARYGKMAETLGIARQVVWHGQVGHAEVLDEMRRSDVLLFTSIIEGTPHVVLEAIQESLPVVCFNTCGQGEVVSERVGAKVEISAPDDSIRQFSDILSDLYADRERLARWRANCKERGAELSWDGKVRQMVGIYENITR